MKCLSSKLRLALRHIYFLQREKTLLQEYKVRHKSNLFVDRRIGENDASMDPEKKMALRLAAEKKRQFGRVCLREA